MTDPIVDTEGSEVTEPVEVIEPVDQAAQIEAWTDSPPDPSVPARRVSTIPGSGLSIVPAETEIAALAQLATTLCAAQSVPTALRDRPNDTFLVLLTARDLGVSLTTAIREFHVIDGKVTCSPKVRKGMVQAAGLGRIWADPDNDERSATWYAIRADDPDQRVHKSMFTMDDAARVTTKDYGKTVKLSEKSNWRQYPKRMLSWRALGYLLDDVFSEVGTGLYSPDEMGAVTDEDGNPVIDVTATEVAPGMNEPRGRQKAREPDPADPADIEALRVRIDAIKKVPDAAAALAAEWTAVTETGGRRLNQLANLWAHEVDDASSLVAEIEARIAAGEWAAQDAPGSTDGDGEGDSPSEPLDAPDSGPGALVEPDGRAVAVAEHVKAMALPDVIMALADRDLSSAGNTEAQQLRLAQALYTEGFDPRSVSDPEPVDEPDLRPLRDRLGSMTKRELVAAAVSHFVTSGGTKEELIDRLDEYLTGEGWEPGDPVIKLDQSTPRD